MEDDYGTELIKESNQTPPIKDTTQPKATPVKQPKPNTGDESEDDYGIELVRQYDPSKQKTAQIARVKAEKPKQVEEAKVQAADNDDEDPYAKS